MNIYESITSAMADIEPIAKAQKNEKQGWTFRGIDVIMNELQPILKKHGLFVVPEVQKIERQERASKNDGIIMYSIITIKYTIYASDGSSISGSVVGEGMDSGDKASNKAMSIGLKYFLLQLFCIPTADEKDPDAEIYEPKPQQQIIKIKIMNIDEAVEKLNSCKTMDELKNTFIALRGHILAKDLDYFIQAKDIIKSKFEKEGASQAFDDAAGEVVKIGRLSNENNS